MITKQPEIERLDEVRSSHLDLSEEDWTFRQKAFDSPDYLSRASFGVFDQDNPLIMFPIQSWPTFARRDKIEQVRRASVGICNLLKSIPSRIFHGDPKGFAEYYGLKNRRATRYLLESPNGIDSAVGRGDFIQTKTDLKCLEFNIVANLGGWETAILAHMHLESTLTAELISELGISVSYADTTDLLFSHILQEVERASLGENGEINIALAVGEGLSSDQKPALNQFLNQAYQDSLQQRDASLTGRLLICRFHELALRGTDTYLGHHRIHAVLDVFPGPVNLSVFTSFKAGRLLLLNGPALHQVSDKRSMALLSEKESSGLFSDAERAILRAHLPWTRLARAQRTSFRDEECFLPDLFDSRREELVVKHSKMGGGRGVFVGRYSTAAQWSDVVQHALAEPEWIVQEFVSSVPYLFQSGDYGCSTHDVVWSPFVFGNEYAGCVLRMQPIAENAIVNLSQAANEGILFEIDDDATT